MHLKVCQKTFVYIAFVLFTLLHAVAMKTGGSHSRLCYTLFKIYHKMFYLQQTYQFFIERNSKSSSFQKRKFHGEGVPEFGGEIGESIGT